MAIITKQKGRVGSATETDFTSITIPLSEGEVGLQHNRKEISIGTKSGNFIIEGTERTDERIDNAIGSIHGTLFEARAEQVRRLTAGSGFVEWGSNPSYPVGYEAYGYYKIGYGLICAGDGNRDGVFYLGRIGLPEYAPSPICNVNGYLLKIYDAKSIYNSFTIKTPPPPSSPDQLYRQDLVFFEVWHEKISEKDVVFPYGNVQYGATSYNGISTTLITDLGINEQYSWFGTWEDDLDASERTVGRGIRWSTLSESDKAKILADKWNNIYINKDGKYVQVRYRVRVVPAGVENNGCFDLSRINPQIGAVDIYKFFRQYVNGNTILVRGKWETFSDFSNVNDSDETFYTYVSTQNFIPQQYGYQQGAFYSNLNLVHTDFGSVMAIPIALVARRNIGAYHTTYNPNGSAKFTDGTNSLMWWEVTPTAPSFTITGGNIEDTDGDGTNDLFQFYVAGDQTSEIKKDYFVEVSGSTSNDGRYWVTDVIYDSDNDRTVITVGNAIPSTTFDGSLTSDFGYVKYCFDNRDTDSGTIGSTNGSGRPDGLFADEINEGDVKDLRNYALKVKDYNRTLDKEFEWLLNGKMRGWEGTLRTFFPYSSKGFSSNTTGLNFKGPEPRYFDKVFWYGDIVYSKNRYIGWYYPWGSPWGDDGYAKYFWDVYIDTVNRLIIYSNSNFYFKNLLNRDRFASDNINILKGEWFEGICQIVGDYGESFIPTDDFSATVDSSDNTKCTISGDKTYAIKKNARLFYRGANGYGVVRVKSVSYDSVNDITTIICDGALGNVGDSINVSTCIGSNDGTKQVYVVKLSRKPKDANAIKILIKKADGTWYPYNSFNAVSVYNTSDIQTQINNTTGAGYEIRFNSYLNWLSLNISELYSALGYVDEDDFKQNAVIEVYYVTEANLLSFTSGEHYDATLAFTRAYLGCLGNDYNRKGLVNFNSKIQEAFSPGSWTSSQFYVLVENMTYLNRVYYPTYQSIKISLPTNPLNMKQGDFLVILPVLLHNNGKLYLNVHYNEVIYDRNANDVGWEGALLVADYETVSTDANGNKFIVGQKWVELPYFVDPEAQY